MATTTTTKVDVIIIGAGIAGLAAAETLTSGGYGNFVVLEAADRTGGRIHSLPFDGALLDMGAQWIHGQHGNPIYDLAKQHGLVRQRPMCPQLRGMVQSSKDWLDIFYMPDGEQVPSTLVRRFASIVDDILTELLQLSADGVQHSYRSVGEFAHERFASAAAALELSERERRMFRGVYDWVRLLETIENASGSLDDLDINGYNQYTLCGGEANVELEGSFSSVLRVVEASTPPAKIRLGRRVTNIRLQPGDAAATTVLCDDGIAYEAKHVIVTVSLGCLKAHAGALFDPPLPPYKLRTIARMGFGTVNKIYLEFPYCFWEPGVDGVQLFPDDGAAERLVSGDIAALWQTAIVGFATLRAHPRVLETFLAGRAAEHMETLDDDAVAETVVARLAAYLRRADIPRPTRVVRTAWRSDPNVLGSYSHIPVSGSSQDPNNLSQPVPSHENPRLLFAGEATSPRFYSTAHGALLSGQREAKRILTFHYKKQNKVKY